MSAEPSLLQRATDRAASVAYLAVVPVLLSVLAFDKVAAALGAGGGGITFPLPPAVGTLWTFVSLPGGGVGFRTPVSLLWFPVFLVVEAAITAGYLASIDDVCRGVDPDFGRGVREYTPGMVVVQAVVALVTFGVFLVAIAFGPGFLLLAVPTVLALAYLLYGAPYLLVVRDLDAFEALGASVEYALDGGRYATFAIGFLVIGAIASIPLSVVVRNGGIAGIAVGLALVAYPSLVGSVATMLVIRDVSSAGESDGESGGASGGASPPGDDPGTPRGETGEPSGDDSEPGLQQADPKRPDETGGDGPDGSTSSV